MILNIHVRKIPGSSSDKFYKTPDLATDLCNTTKRDFALKFGMKILRLKIEDAAKMVTGEVGDGQTRRCDCGFSFENFKVLMLMCLVKSARQFTSTFNVNLNLGFSL